MHHRVRARATVLANNSDSAHIRRSPGASQLVLTPRTVKPKPEPTTKSLTMFETQHLRGTGDRADPHSDANRKPGQVILNELDLTTASAPQV